MTLGDMIKAIRRAEYERVEIRDSDNNEICTCPASSADNMPFKDYCVTAWFPHGAPGKDATFTVCVSDSAKRGEEE